MKLQRLVIETGDGAALTLVLHPRLTVVGGLDAPMTTALADVLGRSLRGGIPGIHVDFTLDDGRELRAVRSADGSSVITDRTTGAVLAPAWANGDDSAPLHALGGGSVAVGRSIDRTTLLDGTSTDVAGAEFLAAVEGLHLLAHDTLSVDLRAAGRRANALLTSIASARGTGPEPMPTIVGDVFSDLEPAVEPMLLDLLATSSRSGQVIVLAERESLTSWARLEQLTGDVAVIEPALAGVR